MHPGVHSKVKRFFLPTRLLSKRCTLDQIQRYVVPLEVAAGKLPQQLHQRLYLCLLVHGGTRCVRLLFTALQFSLLAPSRLVLNFASLSRFPG